MVSLTLLLELFFRSIDPTSLNRQGNDCGTRYRTGIYYTADEDIPTIREVYRDIERIVGEPLMVEVESLRNFYIGEEVDPEVYKKYILDLGNFIAALDK